MNEENLYGKLIEVGRDEALKNVIVIEVVPGQNITIGGISETVCRRIAKFMYQEISLTIGVTP